MKRVACVALAVCFACGLARPYPELEPEEGAERCADGLDQDLDGKVDCADADCAGHCAERGAEACTDGWDQDADGLVDHQDPTCWPYAWVELEDCVSTFDPAGALSLTDETRWLGTGRLLEYREPDGALVRAMIGQLGQHLASTEPSAGALRGSELELGFSLQPGGMLELHLWPAADDFTGSFDREAHPAGLTVELGLAPTLDDRNVTIEPPWVRIDAGEAVPAIVSLSQERLPASTWHRLRIVLVDGVELWLNDAPAPLRLTRGGVALSPRWPEAWSETQALRFAWRVPSPAEARLREVVWDRPPDHPCGVPVPQLDGRALAAATLPSGELCVLEWSEGALATHAYSTADGALSAPLATLIRPGLDALGGALTWSPARHALVGVLLLGRERVQASLRIESPDCASWTLEDAGLDPDLLLLTDPAGLAYEVDADGAHTLHVSVGSGDTFVLRSPDGAPGSFAFAADAHYRRPIPDIARGYVSASTTLFGPERLVTTFAAEGLVLHRWDGGDRWTRLGPLAVPSRQPGRFDANRVSGGSLVIAPPSGAGADLQGWLLIQGDPGSEVAAPSSTALLRLGVRPR